METSVMPYMLAFIACYTRYAIEIYYPLNPITANMYISTLPKDHFILFFLQCCLFLLEQLWIDNCIKDMLMLLKNILGESRNKLSIILRDSINLRELLTPFAAFLGGPLTQNKEKLGNRELSCQSFSEILRISKKVWHETHQYLK